MRDFPEYRDIPLAVGGDGPRSVLCTCNYQARNFGVRSAMPASKEKSLCPELTIVHEWTSHTLHPISYIVTSIKRCL